MVQGPLVFSIICLSGHGPWHSLLPNPLKQSFSSCTNFVFDLYSLQSFILVFPSPPSLVSRLNKFPTKPQYNPKRNVLDKMNRHPMYRTDPFQIISELLTPKSQSSLPFFVSRTTKKTSTELQNLTEELTYKCTSDKMWI